VSPGSLSLPFPFSSPGLILPPPPPLRKVKTKGIRIGRDFSSGGVIGERILLSLTVVLVVPFLISLFPLSPECHWQGRGSAITLPSSAAAGRRYALRGTQTEILSILEHPPGSRRDSYRGGNKTNLTGEGIPSGPSPHSNPSLKRLTNNIHPISYFDSQNLQNTFTPTHGGVGGGDQAPFRVHFGSPFHFKRKKPESLPVTFFKSIRPLSLPSLLFPFPWVTFTLLTFTQLTFLSSPFSLPPPPVPGHLRL